MSRTLITITIVAVVLAVGAVIAIAVVNMKDEPAVPPVTSAAPTVAAAPSETETPAAAPRISRRRPSSETASATQAKADAAKTPDQPEAAAGNDRTAELRQMVSNMSEDDRRILQGELMRQQMRDRQERQKYDLASDRRLRRLEFTRDEKLRLTDAQQAQITALRDSYKPQIDALMTDTWAQQAQLQTQAEALMGSGNRDEARALFEQMNTLRQQSDEIKAPLETQYSAALSGILTAEQQTAMAQENGNDGGGRTGRRGGGDLGGFGGRTRGGNTGGGAQAGDGAN